MLMMMIWLKPLLGTYNLKFSEHGSPIRPYQQLNHTTENILENMKEEDIPNKNEFLQLLTGIIIMNCCKGILEKYDLY